MKKLTAGEGSDRFPPGDLEEILAGLPRPPDRRILAGGTGNEGAAILRMPPGKALVQTVDFLTPILNDPYKFGQIAAANSLSDVYAMGGEPYAAMNVVWFPASVMDKAILREMLRGGLDKIAEAGAVLAGGHCVQAEEIKYGLSVSGLVHPERIATNAGLQPGDRLLLTKPLGTGVVSTAIKAGFGDVPALEELLFAWAGRLNKTGGRVIAELGLKAATDITGFGLGGHLLEMAKASGVGIELRLEDIPFFDAAVELAGMGMIPAGSFANKAFCSGSVRVGPGVDELLADLVFDAQTSGGLILAVKEHQLERARGMLVEAGDLAAEVGRVVRPDGSRSVLSLL